MTTPATDILYTSKDGRWAICSRLADRYYRKPGARHLRCSPPGYVCKMHSWYSSEKPFCWNCNKPVPEDIQTLLTLYVFGGDQ
jgi:hypothetical protein